MANVAEKKIPMSVILEGGKDKGIIVSINDWMEAKSGTLEFVFNARRDWSCLATIRDIKEELFACPDEALQISSRSYENKKGHISFPINTVL